MSDIVTEEVVKELSEDLQKLSALLRELYVNAPAGSFPPEKLLDVAVEIDHVNARLT